MLVCKVTYSRTPPFVHKDCHEIPQLHAAREIRYHRTLK